MANSEDRAGEPGLKKEDPQRGDERGAPAGRNFPGEQKGGRGLPQNDPESGSSGSDRNQPSGERSPSASEEEEEGE